MKNPYNSFLIIFVILIAVGFLGWAIFAKQKSPPSICGEYEQGLVEIGGKSMEMDISDTDCKRELGLSDRKSLLDSSGMIFVFEKTGNYGFWMKEMNFPIDMVWVGSDLKIVGIENSIAPETFPKVFGQKYFAKYVLELPSGFSEKNSITVGKEIKITQN